MVAALSWMSMGKPSGGPSARVLASRLTPVQRELVEELGVRVAGVCRPGTPLMVPGGGLSVLTSALLEASRVAYSPENASRTMCAAGPVELEASSMSLPSRGASVAMDETVLPRSIAAVLSQPRAFDRSPDEVELPLPGACHAYQDAPSILARLWDARLLRPYALSALEVYDGAVVRAGLFGVVKPGSSKIRVIVDRRRRNALERGLPEVLWDYDTWHHTPEEEAIQNQRLLAFPHGSQFCDLVLGARSTISIDIDDASDYYYLLRWPRTRCEETLVGTAASASSLLLAGARDDDGELARLGSTMCEWGLICPAMGDQKAAHASQAVHQHCLLQRGALLSEEWLTFGYRPPPGPHWHGIYQDDRVLLSVVPPAGEGRDRILQEASSRTAAVEDAYTQVGIVQTRRKARALVCSHDGLGSSYRWPARRCRRAR